MRLEDWISPPLLEDDQLAVLARDYASDPVATVVIDAFLTPDSLEGVRALFEGDGTWTDRYVLRGDPLAMPEASREEWAGTGGERRFSSQLALDAPAPGLELSRGLVHHLQLVRLAGTVGFLRLLGRITGLDVTLEGSQARIMLRGHQMARHTDFGKGRILCAVLYVHRFWPDAFGGRFCQFQQDELVRRVAPLPNRLVLFGTAGGSMHEVEPMSAAAEGAQRWSYSFWYHLTPF